MKTKMSKILLLGLSLIILYLLIGLVQKNTSKRRKLRELARTTTCTVHLKFIDEAKRRYADDNGLVNGDLVGFDQLVNNGYLREYFTCPLAQNRDATKESADESYDIKPIGELPTCKCCPRFHSLTSDVAINNPYVRDARQW
jgi:hypothetical protein